MSTNAGQDRPKTFAEDPGEPLSLEEITAATGLTAEDIAEFPQLMKRALATPRVRPAFDYRAEVERMESLGRALEKSLDERDDKKVAESAPVEELPPDAYCWVMTSEGTRAVKKPEYDKFVKRRREYDMFVDGMTRETSCRVGKGKPRLAKLSPKQQAILLDVIRADKPIRPRATETGKTYQSMTSATHLFERARAKADVKLGRYKYRAFRLHENSTKPESKTFEFAPPDDLKFCVIIPG